MVATTTSDANGDYQFANLFPGTFTIEEVLQSGWVQSQPVNPNYYTVTTQSGLNQTGLNFGNYVPNENLSGTVYNDLNGNGTMDPGDPPLAGWTINLLDSSGNLVATTTSAADGTYAFNNEPVQAYTIQEVVQSGWTITQPTNPPGTYTLPPTSGSTTGLDFGDFQLVSVSGNVYNDLNGNGQQNTGEPGLQGWTVDVVDAGGNVVASGVSDAKGNYTITGVGPGSFTLQEVVQSGWIITQPTNPSYYSFTTSSGVNVVGGIFGDFHTVTVSGTVYNDLDGNGQKTGQEPGLASWTVNLEDANGNILASVNTDSNGNYAITGVGPGTYQVAQVVQSGWVQTQPQYPTTYSFTTRSGHNLTALRGDLEI
jgi:protocatechuate 3,4-dioxygenase beta subunit